MKKLSKFFLLSIIVLLSMICTMPVKASMLSLSQSTIYDFSNIATVTANFRWSSPSDTNMNGKCRIYAVSSSGVVVKDSGSISIKTNNGAATYSLSIDMSNISGSGYIYYSVTGDHFTSSGWNYDCNGSCTSFVGYFYDSPQIPESTNLP